MSGDARYLETAAGIGAKLSRDAIWDGARCNWMGWDATYQSGEWIPAYSACTGALYGGTPGIALFLARLYSFTHDKSARRTIEGAVNHAVDRMPSIEPAQRIGFYSGLSGVAYALIEVGCVLEHEPLIQRGISELLSLRTVPLDDRMVDVIGGCAGCIPALLDVGSRFRRDDLLEEAQRQGEHLLALATKSDAGWSWGTVRVAVQQHLLGYSHGAAGIITALLQLHQVTGDAKFLEAGREGLRYERAYFDRQHGNWPDFRLLPDDSSGARKMPIAWCHGAPGIGMSRIRCLPLLRDDATIREEIEIAIGTTRASLTLPGELDLGRSAPEAFGDRNYSLCHGMCGNAELTLMASQEFAADEHAKRELYDAAALVCDGGIEHFEKPGLEWLCGTNGRLESPNLMTGTSGIGYFYLRMYDPVNVPSILVLNPLSHQASPATSRDWKRE